MEQHTSSGGLFSSQGTDELLPSPNVRPVKLSPTITPPIFRIITVVGSAWRQNMIFCRDIASNIRQVRPPHTSSDKDVTGLLQETLPSAVTISFRMNQFGRSTGLASPGRGSQPGRPTLLLAEPAGGRRTFPVVAHDMK